MIFYRIFCITLPLIHPIRTTGKALLYIEHCNGHILEVGKYISEHTTEYLAF